MNGYIKDSLWIHFPSTGPLLVHHQQWTAVDGYTVQALVPLQIWMEWAKYAQPHNRPVYMWNDDLDGSLWIPQYATPERDIAFVRVTFAKIIPIEHQVLRASRRKEFTCLPQLPRDDYLESLRYAVASDAIMAANVLPSKRE